MKDLIAAVPDEGTPHRTWYPTKAFDQRHWSAAAYWMSSKQEWQVHVNVPAWGVNHHRPSKNPVVFKTEEEAKEYLRQQIVILTLTC